MTQDLVAEYERLKQIKEMREGLPHLYCFPLYMWQKKIWDGVLNDPEGKFRFFYTFAANQIGKSSIMQRVAIALATEPKYWKRFKRRPKTILYFYPDKKTILTEFRDKWQEFLPRNGYENHPKYGYKVKYEGQWLSHIIFNSGITLYFKTYGGQKSGGNSSQKIQGVTPAAIFLDEETPKSLESELMSRLNSPINEGSVMVSNCTPTLGQQYLKDIQDGKRKIPRSMVQTISLYDCLEYWDGSPSIWTLQKIKETEAQYGTQREIDIRVHGKFMRMDGLAVSAFNADVNVKDGHPLRKEWGEVYAGIDYGVGGKTAHPSAITFVKVKHDFTEAKIIHTWKPDNSKRWTVDEVLTKYIEMCNELHIHPHDVNASYDWSMAEMSLIAERRGISIEKANKDRTLGFATLNSLFKNQMLTLYKNGDWETMVEEFGSFSLDGVKEGDDQIDSLRYAITGIMFNFENIQIKAQEQDKPKRISKKRLSRSDDGLQELVDDEVTVEEEINEWNDYYEGF